MMEFEPELAGGDCTSSADAECFGSNWALQVYPRGFVTTYDDAGCLATYGEFNRVPLIKVTSSSKDSTKGARIGLYGRGTYFAPNACKSQQYTCHALLPADAEGGVPDYYTVVITLS